MEVLEITLADNNQILASFDLPVYWTLYFSREDVERMLSECEIQIEPNMLQFITPMKTGRDGIVLAEHFIIRRLGDGKYTIEDRNKKPLTYVNGQAVGLKATPLNSEDVIALPIVRNGQTQSLLLQIRFEQAEIHGEPIKQLTQCARTGKKFIVYWEEHAEMRKHFAVKVEPIIGNPPQKAEGSKNLRPALEVPCPYCTSKDSVYCPKCKIWICMERGQDKWKCAGCGLTYKISEMRGHDVDIKTL
jgi:hypothetical protein